MAVIETSGLGPGGEPVTTTSQQVTPSWTESKTGKVWDPRSVQTFEEWQAAQKALESAQQSGPPVSSPDAADVAAEAQSRENSEKVLAKADAAAQPDPFEATGGVPTMGGKPLMMPQQQATAAKVDRPFTSQEFNATSEMRGPQTYEAAKDEANAYKAQAEARLAKEKAAELAKMEQQRLEMQKQALERINAAAAEHQKAAAKLYEEPSTWQRIMQAIAVGLGAYGSALARGPNHALEIIKAQNEHDLNLKKMRLSAAEEKIKAAGASNEFVEKWAKQQQERLIAIEKAQVDAVAANGAKMLAPFPQAQREWLQATAKMKAENAEKTAKFVQDATEGSATRGSSQEGTKVTTAEMKGGQPQRETVNEFVASKEQAKLLREFEAIVKSNPAAWNAYRDANRELAEFDIAKQGPMGGLIKAGQSAGLSATPIALDQRLDKIEDKKVAADAKRINQIWPIIQTGEARILDPVGVLNEASQEAARKHLNMYTMKPEEAAKISEQFRAQHEERASILGSGQRNIKAARAAARAESEQSTKPSAPPRGLTDEDRAARDWAKAHPRDPRAREILKKVARKQTVGE